MGIIDIRKKIAIMVRKKKGERTEGRPAREVLVLRGDWFMLRGWKGDD